MSVLRPQEHIVRGIVYIVAATLLFTTMTGYQILTRTVAGVDPPQTSVLYNALAGGVVLSAMVPFFWLRQAGSPRDGQGGGGVPAGSAQWAGRRQRAPADG